MVSLPFLHSAGSMTVECMYCYFGYSLQSNSNVQYFKSMKELPLEFFVCNNLEKQMPHLILICIY